MGTVTIVVIRVFICEICGDIHLIIGLLEMRQLDTLVRCLFDIYKQQIPAMVEEFSLQVATVVEIQSSAQDSWQTLYPSNNGGWGSICLIKTCAQV